MDQRLFWRSLLVQGALVGALFLVLALALDKEFFEDYGAITGPVAWALCSIGTARILSLPTGLTLFAALAGGVAGLIVSLVTSHAVGLVIALLVFAASCGGYDAETDAAPAS